MADQLLARVDVPDIRKPRPQSLMQDRINQAIKKSWKSDRLHSLP